MTTATNRTDAELRKELAKLAEAREHVLQDWRQARDTANRLYYIESRAADTAADLHTRTGPGVPELREKATEKARAARQAMRAALVAADDRLSAYGVVAGAIADLEGELDRRARHWQPPTPASVPSLPDPRLTGDERAEALRDLLPKLEVRRRWASERLHEAETRRNESRIYDHSQSAGAFKARHQTPKRSIASGWPTIRASPAGCSKRRPSCAGLKFWPSPEGGRTMNRTQFETWRKDAVASGMPSKMLSILDDAYADLGSGVTKGSVTKPFLGTRGAARPRRIHTAPLGRGFDAHGAGLAHTDPVDHSHSHGADITHSHEHVHDDGSHAHDGHAGTHTAADMVTAAKRVRPCPACYICNAKTLHVDDAWRPVCETSHGVKAMRRPDVPDSVTPEMYGVWQQIEQAVDDAFGNT
jgi:hypothetical protein